VTTKRPPASRRRSGAHHGSASAADRRVGCDALAIAVSAHGLLSKAIVIIAATAGGSRGDRNTRDKGNYGGEAAAVRGRGDGPAGNGDYLGNKGQKARRR
jgi:hypothetical protein